MTHALCVMWKQSLIGILMWEMSTMRWAEWHKDLGDWQRFDSVFILATLLFDGWWLQRCVVGFRVQDLDVGGGMVCEGVGVGLCAFPVWVLLIAFSLFCRYKTKIMIHDISWYIMYQRNAKSFRYTAQKSTLQSRRVYMIHFCVFVAPTCVNVEDSLTHILSLSHTNTHTHTYTHTHTHTHTCHVLFLFWTFLPSFQPSLLLLLLLLFQGSFRGKFAESFAGVIHMQCGFPLA